MTRGSIVRLAGLAFGLAWASLAAAQDGTPLSQRRIEGRVVSVDPQDGSVTVDESAGALSVGASRHHRARHARQEIAAPSEAKLARLRVPPRAMVVRDGLDVRFDEVRPGDEVRASFLTGDPTDTHPWQLEFRSPGGRTAPWGVGTGG